MINLVMSELAEQVSQTTDNQVGQPKEHDKRLKYTPKIMIRLFVLTLLTFINFTLFSQNLVDKVVATVGGEPILLSDIEQQYSYLKEGKKNVNSSAKCGILENMIIQNLLLNQAKLDSIVAKDEEIDSEVNTRAEEILRYMGNDETQFQEYYGKTVSEVKNQMRDPMMQQILIKKMRQEIMSKVSITPAPGRRRPG